jgi:hypothetical protein
MRPLVPALALGLLAGCVTTPAAAPERRVHPEFTQTAMLSLQPGMARAAFLNTFGPPSRTEMSTCGSATAEPWACEILEYTLPPHRLGTYPNIPNRNRFYFDRGYLNSWSTNLVWPDPDWQSAGLTCFPGDSDGTSRGVATAELAASCFLAAAAADSFIIMTRLYAPDLADLSTPEWLQRIEELRCTLLSSTVFRNLIPSRFDFAVLRHDGSRAWVQAVRRSDGAVVPLILEREGAAWFVTRLSMR